MADSKGSEKRVILAKTVAFRWLQDRVREEYRFQVFRSASCEIKKLPSLLRSFRDGKIKMAGVDPLPDLGIEESFDTISLWSSNREALLQLKDWFEERGMETTGMW